MTKDKTPETEETNKIYTYYQNEHGRYTIVFDLYGDNEMICGEESKEPLAKVMTARLNSIMSLQTSLLQKENEAKQQLLDEMATEIQKTISIKDLWLPSGNFPQEHKGEVQALINMYNSLLFILTKYQNQKEGK